MIPALDVAVAFNQQNDKKSWKAVCAGELVHFTSTSGMVALVYSADDGSFTVKFNKFQGAFGDYVQAIRKSLFAILNTLKSAGLPIEGPATVEDMAVVIRAADADRITCEWERPAVYPFTSLAFENGEFVKMLHLNVPEQPHVNALNAALDPSPLSPII